MIGLTWAISAEEPFLADMYFSSPHTSQQLKNLSFRPNPHLLRGLPNKYYEVQTVRIEVNMQAMHI